MNIKERKALLGKFHKDFIVYTLNQISCRAIDRGVAYGGWFEIVFPKALDCEDHALGLVAQEGDAHEEDWKLDLAILLVAGLLNLNGHVSAFALVVEGEDCTSCEE